MNTIEELGQNIKKTIADLIENKRLPEAKGLIAEYEGIVSSDSEIYSMKGIISFIEGDIEKAESILRAGLALDADNFDLLFNLGYLYGNLGKIDLAGEFFGFALLNAKYEEDTKAINEMINEFGLQNNIMSLANYENTVMIINTDDKTAPQAGDDLYLSRKNVAASMRDKDAPLVSIVVVAYNNLEKHTKTCISCILRYTKNIDYELILVDNGSWDGTLEFFKSVAYPKKKIIRITKNLGAFSGSNRGLNEAKGEFVVGIANDVYVTKNWLSNMLKCAVSEEKIGIIVPLSDNVSNLQSINLDFRNFEEMQSKAAKFNISDSKKWCERLRLIPPIALLRRACMNMIGMQDYGFFHDFADDDLTFRVRRAGYKAILCKDTFVQHAGHTIMKNPEEYQESLEKGRIIFRDKYHGIDAWDDVNNYETNLISCVELKDCKQDTALQVLGIDCLCGTPILELKNKLRESGFFNVVLSSYTSEAKYWQDLKTICRGEVVVDRVDFLNEHFEDEKFDYIIIGKPINLYKDPFKTLNMIVRILSSNGQLLLKVRNTFDISNLMKLFGFKLNIINENVFVISMEELRECIMKNGCQITRGVNEVYSFGETELAEMRSIISNDVLMEKAIVRDTIYSLRKNKHEEFEKSQ